MKIPNPHESIKQYAKLKGVSVRKACERAGVRPDTVVRWKHYEPNPIKSHNKIIEAIDQIAHERAMI